MPFLTLNSDGLAIACFLAPHDWAGKTLAISHYFPTDIAAGLSGREARRPQAEAVLLTLGVRITRSKAEAQALRQQLATLGTSWVGVPIWSDQFLGAHALAPGQRIYAAQRLLDLTAPAIVAADAALSPTHTYAPLVVGHITELPDVMAISGNTARCAFTLTEDSPWAFRLGSVVAPSAAAFPALNPDWNTPPKQTPVQGLKFGRIGQQRERTIAQQERALCWSATANFTLTDKTAVATLLGFFIAARGQWAAFTSPLWFAPGAPSAEAPNETTVRFADDTLKLNFTTARAATAEVRLMQLPWEIAGVEGEVPQQPSRIFLYKITHDVPTPQFWRFTNCWRALTRTDDGTYAPAPMEHDVISAGLQVAGEAVTLKSFVFAGNPLALFNPTQLEGRMLLDIFEVAIDPLDADAAELVWSGNIQSAPQTGRTYNAPCAWLGGLMDREGPMVRIGPSCNTWFGSTSCGHNLADFLKAGTLDDADGVTVTVLASDASPANTYAPGKFEVGAGAAYEARSIVASTPVAGGQQFTLAAPLRQLATGQAVAYRRSCGGEQATCIALDPTGWRARYRGMNNVPLVDFSLPDFTPGKTGKK